MSLITRCTACQTLFKVVPDQLRMSDGWVRCGQCGEVFDASSELLPSASAGAKLNGIDSPLEQPLPEAQDADVSETVSEDPVAAPIDDPGFDIPLAPQTQLEIDPNDLQDPDRQSITQLSPPSFLVTSDDASMRRKSFIRFGLIGLCLFLLSGLAGQVMLRERDRIVVLQPGLKNFFLALCRPLNCILSPLRQKDAIVIDGASFSKIKPDTYRLNFTLKNTATTALALPALELTLTDSLDQPVLRRVFLAAELASQTDSLAASSEWTTSLTMVVKTVGMAERIMGYRLLAYYP